MSAVDLARRRRVARQARVHDDIGVRPLKGNGPRHHLVQHGAEAVDVGALVAALALDLLRRHVVRRAHHRRKARKRQPTQPRRLGDAEVHDAQRAVVAEHHVLRLQVAVDHVLLVHVVQRVAQPAGDLEGVGDRQSAPRCASDCRKRLALQKLHRHVGPALLCDRNVCRMKGWLSRRPISSSRWKRVKKPGSLSNCIDGTLRATVLPVCGRPPCRSRPCRCGRRRRGCGSGCRARRRSGLRGS